MDEMVLHEEVIRGYNINEANCNGILTRLYRERDKISKTIDLAISKGDDIAQEMYEKKYHEMVDDIDAICEYRKHHECLLEGDPGYSEY